MKPRYIPPDLKVGDHCWLLLGTILHEVEVVETLPCLENTPQFFTMYKVKLQEPWDTYTWYFQRESQHRSNLFLRPAEYPQLVERIESDVESLEYLKKELADSQQEIEA